MIVKPVVQHAFAAECVYSNNRALEQISFTIRQAVWNRREGWQRKSLIVIKTSMPDNIIIEHCATNLELIPSEATGSKTELTDAFTIIVGTF